MGEFRDYDGGETALGLGPFTYMLAYNDHATFFQFVPRETESQRDRRHLAGAAGRPAKARTTIAHD